MDGDFSGRRRPRRLFLVCVMFVLGAISVAACDLGPIDIGGPTPTPLGPTATATPPPRALMGRAEDAFTGKPLEGVEITAGGVLTATNADGLFYFDHVPPNTSLIAAAEGYYGVEVDTATLEVLTVKLRPSTLTGQVTDASTGEPLEGVLVKLVLPSAANAITDTTVTATVEVTATATITDTGGIMKGLAAPMPAVTGTPARPAATTTRRSPTRAVTSTSVVRPTFTDTPIPPTPTVTPTPRPDPPTGEGFLATYTDASGNYTFTNVPEGASLTFKMPGYKLVRMPLDNTTRTDVALEVFKVEAIYITAEVVAARDFFDELIEFALESRINGVVINVQNDASEWVFDTKNPEVLEADNTSIFLPHMPEVVKELQDKGLYVIARVVTFQQKTMAEARPDWAVRSSVTGAPWKGGYAGHQKWLDASNPEVQDHLIAMTKEVLALGFDEVQYDYVRFPSDPAPSEPGDMVFSRPLTDTTKALALQQFLKKAHGTIEPTDAFMSIDVFGYTLWPDQGGVPILGAIGQVLEYIQDYTDYICPMIYPSHFSPGEQGCLQPAVCAYELVHKSGEFAQARFEGRKVKYRPWLQHFDWGKVDYTSPRSTKIMDQIRAAEETGAWGWQMWDPANLYRPRSVYNK